MSNESDPIFPDGAALHPSLGLVTWHPRGLLDLTLARPALHFMEVKEQGADQPFHRFADLPGLDANHLSVAEVEDLAQSRIESYPHAA